MVRTRWFITLTKPISGYQTAETAKVKKTQKIIHKDYAATYFSQLTEKISSTVLSTRKDYFQHALFWKKPLLFQLQCRRAFIVRWNWSNDRVVDGAWWHITEGCK